MKVTDSIRLSAIVREGTPMLEKLRHLLSLRESYSCPLNELSSTGIIQKIVLRELAGEFWKSAKYGEGMVLRPYFYFVFDFLLE